MKKVRGLAVAAIASLAFSVLVPAAAGALSAQAAGMGGWDGHWAGAWGGSDPTAINIKGNRVVSYEYGGQVHPVSGSKVSGAKIVYGEQDVTVTVTRTGANSAHATIHTSQGDGTADLTRK